jgi:AcrR family transcriptional regulator
MDHNEIVDKRAPNELAADTGTRRERKQRTRQALLLAALRLLEDQSFSSLSLREVTREAGIVPTAFYRHFQNMEELGLALVDESFRTLRTMIRSARSGSDRDEDAIRSSVEVLVRHVHAHGLHFRFIARERYSGVAALRRAIRAEIRLFSSELATDLARRPQLDRWSVADLHMIAALIVNAMISTAEAILDATGDSAAAEAEIIHTAEKQLRLVMLGVPHWNSAPIGPRARGAGSTVVPGPERE